MSGEFFKSELVKGDIQEMMVLQEFCFKSAQNLMLLSKEAKMEYFEALKLLLEKQKIFHTRCKLSDDPEAKSIVENMRNCVIMLGGDSKLTVEDMFDDLLTKINGFEEQLDRIK